MDLVYAGTYFDGNSSRPHPAQVILEPGQLRITYQAPDQPVPVSVYWQPSRIRPELFPDQQLTALSYGEFPVQKLEVIDPGFNQNLKNHYQSTPISQPQTVLPVGKVRPWFWIAALVLFASVIGFYFWGLPRLADRIAGVIPQSTDEYLGKQIQEQVLSANEQAPELTKHVRGFLRQLRLQSSYKLQVTVIEEPVANAFALPGGYLVVHNGLLKRLQQPEELAALLGHETGHVQNRHTTRALFRSVASYAFISLIFGDISGITTVILQNADVLKRLEYSRQLEREADAFGFKMLQQNHISPQGMVQLFQKLKQEEKASGNNTGEEFLSTHPALDSRMRAIRKMIKENPYVVNPPDSLQYHWLKIKEIQNQNSEETSAE